MVVKGNEEAKSKGNIDGIDCRGGRKPSRVVSSHGVVSERVESVGMDFLLDICYVKEKSEWGRRARGLCVLMQGIGRVLREW